MLYSFGESESICRETEALSPRGRNRALGSTAILPASLACPSGESEPICREIVALFPSPVQTGRAPVPSLRGMPCHSRLLRYSASPEIRFTPRPCKPSGLQARSARRIRESEASRLLRTKHATKHAMQIYLHGSRLLRIFAKL